MQAGQKGYTGWPRVQFEAGPTPGTQPCRSPASAYFDLNHAHIQRPLACTPAQTRTRACEYHAIVHACAQRGDILILIFVRVLAFAFAFASVCARAYACVCEQNAQALIHMWMHMRLQTQSCTFQTKLTKLILRLGLQAPVYFSDTGKEDSPRKFPYFA